MRYWEEGPLRGGYVTGVEPSQMLLVPLLTMISEREVFPTFHILSLSSPCTCMRTQPSEIWEMSLNQSSTCLPSSNLRSYEGEVSAASEPPSQEEPLMDTAPTFHPGQWKETKAILRA